MDLKSLPKPVKVALIVIFCASLCLGGAMLLGVILG